MAKKKSGSIAVPFLVTVFISLIVVGGTALWFYNHFGFGKSDNPPLPTPRTGQTISVEDNHTILFILDEPEQRCPSTFVLMRAIPLKKELIFIGLPTNMISLVDGQQQGLKDSYDRGGCNAAVDFVQKAFDITIDRYMKLESASLQKICDIFGGVSFEVNIDMAGFVPDGSAQYMNAKQIDKFITYSMFRDGERERALQAAAVIAAMINQADGKRIADNFDNSFTSIINMTNDTTVTSVDYKNHKTAIKTMFGSDASIATSLILDGTDADNDFLPSNKFIEDVKKQYFVDEKTDK
ncbi:MAG: LCP family protein [Ruminococcus sp.]|nr:LCP family protein [Ruminococcus sp.]